MLVSGWTVYDLYSLIQILHFQILLSIKTKIWWTLNDIRKGIKNSWSLYLCLSLSLSLSFLFTIPLFWDKIPQCSSFSSETCSLPASASQGLVIQMCTTMLGLTPDTLCSRNNTVVLIWHALASLSILETWWYLHISLVREDLYAAGESTEAKTTAKNPTKCRTTFHKGLRCH